MSYTVKALQKTGPNEPFQVADIERRPPARMTSSLTLRLLASAIPTFTPFAMSGARRIFR